VIQIEEPAIHSTAAYNPDPDVLNWLVDLYNRHVEGLDDVEIWVHTCWGNPGAQHCFDANISYENSIDTYLNKVKCDVWTVESKDANHRPLELFKNYGKKLDKKIAPGFISHRTLQVESPEEVAADVRMWAEVVGAENLVLSSDCGFGRQGVPRPIAFYKAVALAQGANIVREELGARTSPVPAAEPGFQVDLPASAPAGVAG
jgi:5-methyltetrahydropteroyltriglutamate--homocysteine methyltransferase